MYQIGIISDTHGLVRQKVKETLQNCDAILHAGDFHQKAVLDELKQIAPLYAVRGNVDKEWGMMLPSSLDIMLFGIPIKMIHNKKELPQDLGTAKLVVFGHSHQYLDREENGIHFLNPGSCGPRRFHQPITMAVIDVAKEGIYTVRKIDIVETVAGKMSKWPQKNKDQHKLVMAIMQDVDKGWTVEQIAKEYHMDTKLIEQICRMYLTHPGVDVDGILNRVGGL